MIRDVYGVIRVRSAKEGIEKVRTQDFLFHFLFRISVFLVSVCVLCFRFPASSSENQMLSQGDNIAVRNGIHSTRMRLLTLF